MLRKIILFLFCVINLYAIKPSVEELIWPNGESFLMFLENNKIPLALYYNLEKEDQELASEIMSGTRFQILRDEFDNITQVLIPISEELQIHIYKDHLGKFVLEFLPIIYSTEDLVLSIDINRSPYQDIISNTGNVALASSFMNAFKGSVDFKGLRKGDRLVIIYSQKRRLGRVFGMPNIKASMVEIRGKAKYVYQYDDRFYDKTGKELENFFLVKPVLNARISSRFNPKRWHPILKRYRAHLGMDYAAPKGTKIYAAGDGVVSFVGNKGGYGKVLTIRHTDNYMTLYAHLNGFATGMRNGKNVKKGQLIAYVGNTGMSTGPHLHFGLYKNNQAINPESIVKIAKSILSGKQKIEFNALVEKFNNEFISSSNGHVNAPKEEDFENVIAF
ncbi:peptidoglycan DD-metalloendopeptidase family protein [Campylobacter hyointestinalis]|uniref:peptidoglycan DD-metalloendopeptidase family protein n=1 Tax=Campylobacter hyointestinalis TaxID=198 RepID=UPI0007C93747|nr:peptidoglycan DD-metalloendopeptidase family protein [Campylobacter hyointestinalis]ANE34393.1 zinc metallopeptidase, M23 family [Campylobacter hyointestinalis subsp. lawsonii CCUG 27631]MBT0611518.1 peptidoglycan DD-metalloendopeptidase family protein [Campylobacter hyointestinalis subsp. hyointestinalis]RAZ26576.1 M23 family peptidase [Campylobacter hyointestinalis subsp. lawsonii]RAZ40454.1 M23 family peptidase [Campylobacter hyointestinalis subsp. lawsonii]RAZ48813.1 M23 family peptidas